MDTGWAKEWGRWELRWNNRTVAIVTPRADGTVDLTLNARKMWQIKHVTAANEQLGKRYAERWCAARLLPDLPLKEAVRRITGAV